jgi:hypothetical protein
VAGSAVVSLLEQPLGEYLAVRRALGYKLERAGKLLAQFPALLDEQDRRTVTTELALEWAMLPPASDFELAPTPLSPSARGGAEGGWSRSSALLCRPPGAEAAACDGSLMGAIRDGPRSGVRFQRHVPRQRWGELGFCGPY